MPPETLTAPPSAAPAGVTIVEPSTPPKAPPAPTTTIKVSEMPKGDTSTPPKRGSAREEMHRALRAKATGGEPEKADSPAPTTHAGEKSQETGDPTPPASSASETDDQTPPAEGQAATGKAGTEDGKPKPKANPWKLYEAEKQQRAKVEAEAQELRARIPKEGDVKSLTSRAETAEKLAKELSDEIRYHNYEASPEFKDNFHAPYEKAFSNALKELSEVGFTDPQTNQSRPINAEDLANLAFLPLPQAKKIAADVFGDFADDVMAARKEIRGLWDKRQAALEDWKGKGSERARVSEETAKRQAVELNTQVRSTWNKASEAALNSEKVGHLFKPKEGDTEWNSRLEKGFKLADEAFGLLSLDSKLHGMKPEDRDKVVEKLVAMRNRAAGWGPLRHANQALQARVTELETELKQYKDSTPGTGGTAPASTSGQPLSAKESMRQALRKLAH